VKEKYQTSVKERDGGDEIEWREKCELKIPSHGNTASIVLNVLTHNLFGVDNFLGCVSIPLAELDVYDRPKNKWFELQDKHGKARTKDRGELEVKIGFSVKPGSLNEASKKDSRRASMGQLSQVAHNVGGSLASISSVDKKSFKKLAKSITKKIKKEKKFPEEDERPASAAATNHTHQTYSSSGSSSSKPSTITSQQTLDADPGVISDDDEFAFDDLSHTGSGCSLEVGHINTTSASATGSAETVASSDAASAVSTPFKDNITKFNTLPSSRSSARSVTPVQEKFVQKWEQKLHEAKKTKALLNKSSERIVVGGETKCTSPTQDKLSPEIIRRYENKTREDLIQMVEDLQISLQRCQRDRKELEDYMIIFYCELWKRRRIFYKIRTPEPHFLLLFTL
jgi:Rab11 family-interacting protein 1/2/5